MRFNLPPLNALPMFEAVCRHRSFRRAANELGVTPSAVSHGIHNLESWLSVELFVRGRVVELTPAAQAYLPGVRQALESIHFATQGLVGAEGGERLHVSVPPTFGLRWLIPRLADFEARYPHIGVIIDTRRKAVTVPIEADVAIRMGRGRWPGLEAIELVRERLVPVCAPARAGQIASAKDVLKSPLIHVDSASEDWATWTSLASLAAPVTWRGVHFDTIHNALEYAARGSGVALGRLPIVDEDLQRGRLVEVGGPPRTCATAYWLVSTREALLRPEVAALRDWVVEISGGSSWKRA